MENNDTFEVIQRIPLDKLNDLKAQDAPSGVKKPHAKEER